MSRKHRNVSESDVERAIYHTLRDEGLLPPESEEDIAALEEELGIFPRSTSHMPDVFQLIKEGMIEPTPSVNSVKLQVEESLAQAARGGVKIPQEIRDLMKKDRDEAEGQRSDQ